MMDALPVLFPQAWGAPPALPLAPDSGGREPEGRVAYAALDDRTARAELGGETRVAAFTMEPHAITLEGSCTPGIRPPAGASPGGGPGVVLEHRGFFYGFRVARGGSGRLDPKVWKLSRRRDRGPDSG